MRDERQHAGIRTRLDHRRVGLRRRRPASRRPAHALLRAASASSRC
jgi:hypothetical protein